MAKLITCKGCGETIYKGTKKCPHCGKKNRKPTGLIVIGVIVLLIVIASLAGKITRNNDKKVTYKWPSYGIAALLPEPAAKYGKIYSKSEDYFSIELYFVSQSDFENYVDACRESGFTVDYREFSSHYYADDKNGNSLTISFDNKDAEMSISLSAANEETEEDSNTENREETTDAENEEDSNIENGAEGTEAGSDNIESNTNEADSETETEEIPDANAPDEENMEFRAWVDSYEAFMNSYIDFMEKYDSSDTLALLEYTKLVAEYAEFMDTVGKLEEGDYSVSDWAYYMAAYTRISVRLSTIQ